MYRLLIPSSGITEKVEKCRPGQVAHPLTELEFSVLH
jgi:hypothetical protein